VDLKKSMKLIDRPPSSLQAPGKDLWTSVVREYPLNLTSKKVLFQAAEALDRLRQIQTELKVTGLTFTDKAKQPKLHPLVLAEASARQQFVRCMRLLNLDFSEAVTDENPE
jgi:hypothetical protein